MKRNSLVENNSLAKFFNDIFIKAMDRFVWIRSMTIFSFLAFFLGNNLNVFLWMFVTITLYQIGYRFIRFWVKRLILYLFEFCYFGLLALLLFLLVFPQSKFFWYAAYAANTGVMSLAVIFLNNQAAFNSTDHLTSAWLHCMPMITCWAIRWRSKIYESTMLERFNWGLLDLPTNNFELSSELILEIIYPVIYWSIWALFYVAFFFVYSKDLIQSPKYESSYHDFIKQASNFPMIFGNPRENTEKKYLAQHFFSFFFSIPLALLCYYSFMFNTFYMIVLVLFLIYNAGTKSAKAEYKKNKEIESLKAEVERLTREKKE